MTGWWENLSIREKGLVGAAAAIILLVIGWYGLLAPSMAARADASQARQLASDDLAQIEHLLAARRAKVRPATGVAVSTGAALDSEAFKTAVTQAAQSAGLAISRLQGGETGNFSMVFEQADARQLFYWMNEVETRLGGQIERLSVDQATDARVRATIELSSRGGG